MAAHYVPSRRAIITSLAAIAFRPASAADHQLGHPQTRWYEAAESMRRLAASWVDQDYGAVLVLGDQIVGNGPSRVVRDKNPDAHAERVAIAEAQARLGRTNLEGAVLYSTSRPCSVCEKAAARAGVSRMYFGSGLQDAGAPVAEGR